MCLVSVPRFLPVVTPMTGTDESTRNNRMPEVDRHDKDFYRKLVTEGVDRSEAKSRSRQGTANGLAEALEKGSVPA